jgi:cobalt-zinc-cadmium efflux system outer membrane protein
MACAENPALAEAAARVEAARGRRLQAGLYPNTVIGYSGNEIGIRDTAGQQGASISQRFVTGGKRRLDRAVAEQQIEAARCEFEATRRRVFTDVQIRFYELLIAQQRLHLTEQLAAIGEQSADATRDLLRGGQIRRTDVLQAEIEAESAHVLHDNATGNHRAAWQRLCAVVGVPYIEITTVAGDPAEDLPECSWEACRTRLFSESPELGAAAARVQQARLAVVRARRERLPNVDVSLAVRHQNATGDDAASVQVGFPLPLLDRNQGNIQRAEAELAAACAQLKRTELALYDRLAVAFRGYDNARRQVDRYVRRILPRARESLAWVRAGYAEGQVDFLTLLTSQRTYFRANLDYLDSLEQLRVAAVRLDGLLLTGSLGPAT